ncbi:ABC transporter ATP-binding protein [Oceanospirillum sp.]|uniref:ABC transporter ATP-binding protein n=1 Tax=Oceanospirillum sp. TaxID=2021254 RepID=UPI003A916B91
MSSKPVIALKDVSKTYRLFRKPSDRLIESLPFVKNKSKPFVALKSMDLTVGQGDIVGLIGRNGAGKSTLLQLICGTLQPSSGSVSIKGRIAALLELGSGFNPEFTGRENVFLNGAILGLSRSELEAKFEEIHRFSEIGDAIDQPVKTYSSGMFVRLAFAVAVCVDPDVLVIDEALSVGDGAFAKKSFDRIMQLKESGKTILFCSHNLYQVEAICNRALWLHQGEVIAQGKPSDVIHSYEGFLYGIEQGDTSLPVPDQPQDPGRPQFKQVSVSLDGKPATQTKIPVGITGQSCLSLYVSWQGPAGHPAPSLATTLHAADGRLIASASSQIDEFKQQQSDDGKGCARLDFPQLPLLKGEYWVEVYLLCEQGILFYDQQIPAARFKMQSPDFSLEQGVFHIEREWHAGASLVDSTAAEAETAVENADKASQK